MKLKSYVYALLDPRKPGYFRYGHWVFHHEPFYIGKGVGKRCHTHVKTALGKGSTNPHKDRKIKRILKEKHELIIRIMKSGLSDKASLELEIKLIAKIGRSNFKSGPLTNLTNGGEGVSGISKKLREHRRNLRLGTTMSEETCQKISKALIGHKKSQTTKDKLRVAQSKVKHPTGWKHTEETKAKMSSSKKGQSRPPLSEETRRRISESMKGRTNSAEHIENARMARMRNWSGHTEEVKENMRNHKNAFYASKEGMQTRQKISATLRNRSTS